MLNKLQMHLWPDAMLAQVSAGQDPVEVLTLAFEAGFRLPPEGSEPPPSKGILGGPGAVQAVRRPLDAPEPGPRGGEP